MAAVVGVLTNSSGEKVEFKHDLCSNQTTQGRTENLKSLSIALRKLQDEINSCLTAIMGQEKKTVASSSGLLVNVDAEGNLIIGYFFGAVIKYKAFWVHEPDSCPPTTTAPPPLSPKKIIHLL